MTNHALQERLTRMLGYLAQDPQNFALQVDVAALQLALGQTAEVRRSAEKAIALAGDRPEGYALLGLAAARAGAYADASNALEMALVRGDESPPVIYHHAQALAMQGRYAEARPFAERAAQFAVDYPYAPALYIRVLHYLEDIDAAIAFAETQRTDGAAPPQVDGMLSTLYMDAEDYDKAQDAARTALQQNADDIDALTTLGMLTLGSLNADNALRDFHRILCIEPANGRAMLGLGLTQILAGDVPAAIETLEKTARTTNMRTHLGTWQSLAWCYLLMRQPDKAEQVLNEALELDRSFAETYGALAMVALVRGDREAAQQALRRAHGLDPENVAGQFALSLLESTAGNTQRGGELIDQVLSATKLSDGRSLHAAVAEMLVRTETGMGKTLH